MEHTERRLTRSIDVSGLPQEAVQVVEALVSLLRGQPTLPGGAASSSSREEWIKAIREWASSHQPEAASADWGR
jgi:hypothetical protein